jgi:hypothetical protein
VVALQEAVEEKKSKTALKLAEEAENELSSTMARTTFVPSAGFLWSIANLKLDALNELHRPQDLAFSECASVSSLSFSPALTLSSPRRLLLETRFTPKDPDLQFLRVQALYEFGRLSEALSYAKTLTSTVKLRFVCSSYH